MSASKNKDHTTSQFFSSESSLSLHYPSTYFSFWSAYKNKRSKVLKPIGPSREKFSPVSMRHKVTKGYFYFPALLASQVYCRVTNSINFRFIHLGCERHCETSPLPKSTTQWALFVQSKIQNLGKNGTEMWPSFQRIQMLNCFQKKHTIKPKFWRLDNN